jgi:MoaA/NifB/PqqE/SkfB family radical SAM enzyme
MVNKLLKLNMLEFIVTDACTSKCKHCSFYNGRNLKKSRIDREAAVSAVYDICDKFDIKSILTFGGEPLLFYDTTCSIHSAATKAGIDTRQLITNGYFSNNEVKIKDAVKKIMQSGINNILLSIDAFHDEFIPKDIVYLFAKELKAQDARNLRLHPAWVVSRQENNIYNQKTEECLKYFSDLNIPVSNGNDILLTGMAAEFLTEYYDIEVLDLNTECGSYLNLGTLENVTSISIDPNGDVRICWFVIGNIYQENIIDILKKYNPYEHALMKHIMTGEVARLVEYANNNGLEIDLSQFYDTCEICRHIAQNISIQ